jgi:hypothetical protein
MNRKNPVVLRNDLNIGGISAEGDDDFLFECFQYHPSFEAIRNIDSSKMIILGRTGSGKTAIIRKIEKSYGNISFVDPLEMSLSYITNSDALKFLQAIGADLDIIFQTLWRHVLTIEFLRLFYKVENDDRSKTVFAMLWDRFRPQARKLRALEYLRQWEHKFWIPMDQNIKELTEKFDTKCAAEFGGEIDKFRAGGQYEKRISREKKQEISARFRNIVSVDQLRDLSSVIDMLSEEAKDEDAKKYYILIDKLDENWIDSSVRFIMIRALIETLRSFRKITSLKIAVALRADVLERVMLETSNITFQQEKFEEYFERLKWQEKDLKELVEKRISMLFRRKYTKEGATFEDVFPNKVSGKDSLTYMLERTLFRPRDVIAFVNECLSVSDGKTEITSNMIKSAELEYSRKRKVAIENEWSSALPLLPKMIEIFAGRRKATLAIEALLQDNKIDDFLLYVASLDEKETDPFVMLSKKYFSDEKKDVFVYNLCSILYRCDIIGIKFNRQDRFQYSHIDVPIVDPSVITVDCSVRVHPMLHRALGIDSGA